ncbi:hypothetical protein [Curtobacterium sp. 9128]|uniref:hypothetical protein n=1 Tax=Curtobacterium sp. 9128 TaxID=1793722 RepID=UPI0011A33A60|nr:hypothetical protein [Curtobacterium sp. 9128]
MTASANDRRVRMARFASKLLAIVSAALGGGAVALSFAATTVLLPDRAATDTLHHWAFILIASGLIGVGVASILRHHARER